VSGAAAESSSVRADADAHEAAPESSDDSPRLSFGARAFVAPGAARVGAYGAGLDAMVYLLPEFGLGASANHLRLDQGDTGGGCCYNGSGNLFFLNVEGRLLPELWLSPYARLGAGAAAMDRHWSPGPQSVTSAAFQSELGLDLHAYGLSARAFAGFTSVDDTYQPAFLSYGVQLGALF